MYKWLVRFFGFLTLACAVGAGLFVHPPPGLATATYNSLWLAHLAISVACLLLGIVLAVFVLFFLVRGEPPSKLAAAGASLDFSPSRSALEPSREVDQRLLGRIEQVAGLTADVTARVGKVEEAFDMRLRALEKTHADALKRLSNIERAEQPTGDTFGGPGATAKG